MSNLWEKVDVEAIRSAIASYIPNLLGALILLVAFWAVLIIVRKALAAGLRRTKVPQATAKLLSRVAKYLIIITALVTITGQLGINVTALVAGLGIAGLAVSFAAQDTLQNIISGVLLMVDRPLREGDWICVGEIHAFVGDIRLRTTVLTTFDNETMVVPNKTMVQERVINYTLTPRIRIRVPIGIAYKEDTDAARQVLLKTLEGDERVLDDPAPVVWLMNIGDSRINMELRFWSQDPLEKFPLQWEYTEKCKRALEQAGIQIPFPHLQLMLESSEALSMLAGSGNQTNATP